MPPPSPPPPPSLSPSPPPTPPPPPVSDILFENNALSVSILSTIFTEAPRCLCSYFAPGSTGDVFPIVRRTALSLEAHASNASSPDPLAAVAEIARDAWRAAKLCGSASCRNLVETTFGLVHTLVNTDTATAPPTLSASTCSADA